MVRILMTLLAVITLTTAAFADGQTPARGKTKSPANGPRRHTMTRPQSTGPATISGNPSTLVGCVGGSFYYVLPLGASLRGTRIRVDLDSDEDLDATAAATMLQMGGDHPEGRARASMVFDDDGGGNLDPRLDFTLEYDANVVLSISSYDGDFGCFVVKVDIRMPG